MSILYVYNIRCASYLLTWKYCHVEQGFDYCLTWRVSINTARWKTGRVWGIYLFVNRWNGLLRSQFRYHTYCSGGCCPLVLFKGIASVLCVVGLSKSFSLCTIDTSNGMILCSGGCSVHCMMFSSIPGQPLYASSHPSPLSPKLWCLKMSPNTAKCSLRGRSLPVEHRWAR